MIVIVDIDNTLSLSDERFQFATKENGKIDWDVVHSNENVIKDKPNYPMIDLVRRYKKNNVEIIIITGRPESCRKGTELWLQNYNIPYDKLYMRSEKYHYIKANVLKKKIFEEYINDKVFCAYDDDDSVIQMWVELGITCFKVIPIQ